jgi:NmrA-like family
VRQGKHVAEVGKRVGVSQLVYSGAGPGVRGSGVGSWETKVAVAACVRTLDLPATILHPTAFMELMTEPKFFPPASVWHLMPRLMGSARPLGWLTRSRAGQRRPTYRCVPSPLARGDGPAAPTIPMPRWLFERFAGTGETTMWRWLGTNEVDFDTGPTLATHPEALTVREWLERKQAPSVRRRQGRTST